MTLDTFSDANAVFRYDPETGRVFWRVSRSFNINAGDEAGSGPNSDGYRHIKFCGKSYKVHRLAWLLTHKAWPTHEIDHINGDPGDNRLANLRTATRVENARNTSRHRNNRSGVTGVCFHKQVGKWRAQIRAFGKQQHLGLFTTIEEAVAARKAAEVAQGYHPNHGRA